MTRKVPLVNTKSETLSLFNEKIKLHYGLDITQWSDKSNPIYVVTQFKGFFDGIKSTVPNHEQCHVWKIYPDGYAELIESIDNSDFVESLMIKYNSKKNFRQLFFVKDSIMGTLGGMGFICDPNNDDPNGYVSFIVDPDFKQLTGIDNSLKPKQKTTEIQKIYESQWVRARDYQ